MADKKRLLKILILISIVAISLFAIGGGLALAYHQVYQNKIYSGVYVGNYHLGGLTEKQAKDFVENFNNRLTKEGVDFYFTNQKGETVKFKQNIISSAENSVELVKLDSKRLAGDAIRFGRGPIWRENLARILVAKFSGGYKLSTSVAIEPKFKENLKSYLAAHSSPASNAEIRFKSASTLDYELISEHQGTSFDFDEALAVLNGNLSVLSLAAVEIKLKDFSPDISKADVASSTGKLSDIFSYGDLILNYVNPQTAEKYEWRIAPAEYANWIEPWRDEGKEIIFALKEEKVRQYFDSIKAKIEAEVRDAKFVMENGQVKLFQASQSGILMDAEKTYKDLDTIFKERNYKSAAVRTAISVSTKIIEPKIRLSEANDLGIADIMGAGVSTFYDSHTNRIKNIANAVKRLNGVLIKPDEIFSTNRYAGPYTTDNGYLPEEVIVGNEIKKEVGGGMCQIGTTMFRAAMNSGMPIAERTNHSLVVSYYADPVNGNPGTDATVYEPYVDFKFLNDTGNYLLLQTDIDYQKQRLIFTLWGKNDGRKGWYTRPLVSKWIPAGQAVENMVTNLKPGEKKCQNAFTGAVASFTYSRMTTSGVKIDRVFDSYYRPLPQICMVGVDPKIYCAKPDADKKICTSTSM